MSADDDFPEDLKDELAAARAEQARKQAADAASVAGMRAAVQRIQQIAQQPVEAPAAAASERVEHAAGVALPHSITLDKLPRVQLEPLIDPRRMMTQPSIRAVEGGGLGPAPQALAVVGGRTVGGNTGRFKDAADAVPPSADLLDSHELPVQTAPVRRRWLPVILIGGAGVALAALLMRDPTLPEMAQASTRAIADVARAVATTTGGTDVPAPAAPSTASPLAPASPTPPPAQPPGVSATAAPKETPSAKPNPSAAPAAIPPKRLPFEPD